MVIMVKRWLWLGLLLVLCIILYVGVLRWLVDPQPVGQAQRAETFTIAEVNSHSDYELWVDDQIPAADYTVRLTATFVDGETDMVLGVGVGRPDHYLQFVLSPLGYAAVFEIVGNEQVALRPLAPFPHVRRGFEANEWWVTAENEQLVVRLNREVFWVGERPATRPRVLLTAETFGTTSHIQFDELVIYYE